MEETKQKSLSFWLIAFIATLIMGVVAIAVDNHLEAQCSKSIQCFTKEWQANHDNIVEERKVLDISLIESEIEGTKLKAEFYQENGMRSDEDIIHNKTLQEKLPGLQAKLEALKANIIPTANAQGLSSAYELIIENDKVYVIRKEALNISDYSERNKSEIAKLTGDMQWRVDVFMNRLEEAGIHDIVITDSLRSDAQQKELYAKGRTKGGRVVTNIPNCDPQWKSKHCIGEAIDIVQFIDGKPNYSQTPYEEIAKHAEGLEFTWGGNWDFIDKPHFQLDKLEIGLGEPVSESAINPLVDKINSYIANYGRADHANLDNSGHIWVEMQDKYKIKADVAVCISVADTGLGGSLKTKYNYGNVANTDSGNTRAYSSIEQGIEAIFWVVSENIPNAETVCDLNWGCAKKRPYYATSANGNWARNVTSCLVKLNNDTSINKYYNIKSN